MPAEDLPTSWAPEPFHDLSIGDCILKSEEGTGFALSKLTLIAASPVFKGMFDIPQPLEAPQSVGRPVICVTEDAETLLDLLLLLYPAEPPEIKTVERLRNLIDACDKYEISRNRLLLVARVTLVQAEVLECHGMEAFALAWRLGLSNEIKITSEHILPNRFTDWTTRHTFEDWSGSLEPVVALYDLALAQEKALDKAIRGYHPLDGTWNPGYELHQTKRKEQPLTFKTALVCKKEIRNAVLASGKKILRKYFEDSDGIPLWFTSYGEVPCKRCADNAAMKWSHQKMIAREVLLRRVERPEDFGVNIARLSEGKHLEDFGWED